MKIEIEGILEIDHNDWIRIRGEFLEKHISKFQNKNVKITIEEIRMPEATRRIRMTFREFSKRFGLSKLDKTSVNPYAMNEGASESDEICLNRQESLDVGISEEEWDYRSE